MQNLGQAILISILMFSLMNVIKVKPHVPPFQKGPEYLEKYVTRHKKKLNKSDYYSWSTAFMEYAIVEHHNAIADSLLSFGYPPDRKLKTTPYLLTPLCAAVLSNNEHVTQSLLRAGADPNILPPDSLGALMHLGIVYGFQAETIELFLNAGSKPDEVSEFNPPALTAAIIFGNYEIAELLLKRGADVNLIDRQGYSAFQYAAVSGDLVSATFLLENDAEVNTSPNDSNTPLCLALFDGHDSMVLFLLSAGANPDSCASTDRLPLASALVNKNYDMINRLLAAGADIEKTDYTGRNYISSVFSETNNIHITETQNLMETLLRDNFDAVVSNTFRDFDMAQLFYLAAVESFEELEQFEKQSHADEDKHVVDQHSEMDAEKLLTSIMQVTELFIRYDLDITQPLKSGATILHVLVKFEDEALRQRIIDQFQDVNGQDKYGGTPLHFAVQGEDLRLMQQLLEAGADVNIKDYQDLTVLDYAILAGNETMIDIIETAGGVVGK